MPKFHNASIAFDVLYRWVCGDESMYKEVSRFPDA